MITTPASLAITLTPACVLRHRALETTLAVKAYVMATEQLPCPKAFRVVKKAHRPACPNEGFRAQLKLFEAMGFKIDPEYPE